jgi:type II secretory pathway pseudopilin PulG
MKTKIDKSNKWALAAKEGFSLLEVVIATLVFTIIGSSIVVLVTRSQKVFVSQQQMLSTQQNARKSLDYITENISQAGYGVASPQASQALTGQNPLIGGNFPVDNGKTSAFADFVAFDAGTMPVDATHIFLKGCFGKVYGSLTAAYTVPGGSVFPMPTTTLVVGVLNGTFSANDTVMMYDFSPSTSRFYWVYGTVSSVASVTPPLINATINFTDGTSPGGATGMYTFGQGAMIYKVETRAFRLNGDVLEVSDNGNPYETLIEHVNQLWFRYFDNTNTEIASPLSTLQDRARIETVQIQITAQSVNNDMQTKLPLRVTYSSTATPRNFQFKL